jgi:ribose/xylose/arabinose/galactoside ABC-type transport system permease subunit
VALQAIPLGLAALGQSLVILLAGVDLSIGSVMSLVTAIASSLIVADTLGSAMLGAAVALGGGIGVGLLNAVLIRYIQSPDRIATLATSSAVQGIALIVRPRPGGVVSTSFRAAPSSRFSTGAAAACGPVSERPGYPLVLSKRVKWSITTRDRQENQRRV